MSKQVHLAEGHGYIPWWYWTTRSEPAPRRRRIPALLLLALAGASIR